MQGQINLGSKFGNRIYSICKNPEYKKYCEVGTWNGRGSTQCIVQAILDKEDSSNNIFWSVEANKGLYNIANKYYNNKYAFLRLLNGKINRRGIMTREEVENHKFFPLIYEHYLLHYDNEYNSFTTSEYIGDQIDNEIDVVLLDGGEFSTEGDFDFFRDRNVKVYLLDDVNIIKCSRIRQELLNNINYKLLDEDLNDRNGWSIFIRNN